MSGTEPLGLDLAAAQDAFAQALLWRASEIPDDVTSHTGPRVETRFNVYRNNVFASLIEALRSRYPVVQRLVGEEFFQGAVRIFVELSPPRGPVLSEYGETFAAFLESFEPAGALPYLPDVARLEWLCHVAYHAEDRMPMSHAQLADIPLEGDGGIILALHPSVGLIASPFPVVSIWRTNAFDENVCPIGPETGGEAALIVRPHLDVRVVPLTPAAHSFVAAIGNGEPTAAAAAQAQRMGAGFSFTEALATLIKAEAIVGYRFSQPETGGRSP